MSLELALEGISRVLLDTAPVVYYLEGHPDYAPLMDRFMAIQVERPIVCATSPITLSECLILPLRRGDISLSDAYRQVLTAGEGVEFHPLGTREADLAASLRANYNLTLTDAYQSAMAIVTGCQTILSNDRVFTRVREIRTLILDDLKELS